MDKEAIKKELVDISNKILEKYSEMDVVESVSVMNMASKTIFLGSPKVFNYEVIPNVMRDLEKELKGYRDAGISLHLNGRPSTPQAIARACQIAEDGGYMRDYSVGEQGAIADVNFRYIKEKN